MYMTVSIVFCLGKKHIVLYGGVNYIGNNSVKPLGN